MKSAKNIQMTLITLVGLMVLPLSLNAQANQVRRLYAYQSFSPESISEVISIKSTILEARVRVLRMEEWMDNIHYLDAEKIEMENWMTDEGYFQTDQPSIEMEEWMQNPCYLQDEKVELAPWMCNPTYLQKGNTI